MPELFSQAQLLSIFLFAFATAFTPGPNNLMLLSSGLTFGYKHTLAHILGVAIGFPLMVLAIGLGLGVILEKMPILLQLLKVVGIIYLLWMAWKIAHSVEIRDDYSHAKPFTFLQAAVFQWVNPKAWIMALTVISTYTLGNNLLYEVIMIAFIYLIVGLGSTHSWTLGGVYLKRWIKDKKSIRIFNISMALLIVVSVFPFV